jgi:hypothetical protein
MAGTLFCSVSQLAQIFELNSVVVVVVDGNLFSGYPPTWASPARLAELPLSVDRFHTLRGLFCGPSP